MGMSLLDKLSWEAVCKEFRFRLYMPRLYKKCAIHAFYMDGHFLKRYSGLRFTFSTWI